MAPLSCLLTTALIRLIRVIFRFEPTTFECREAQLFAPMVRAIRGSFVATDPVQMPSLEGVADARFVILVAAAPISVREVVEPRIVLSWPPRVLASFLRSGKRRLELETMDGAVTLERPPGLTMACQQWLVSLIGTQSTKWSLGPQAVTMVAGTAVGLTRTPTPWLEPVAVESSWPA